MTARPHPAALVALSASLLAGCDHGHFTLDQDPSDPLRAACVAHVNDLRATKGLAPLSRWVDNEACADSQARSDSETGKAHGAFRSCPGMAQNECPGWPSATGASGIVPGCLDVMWAEGPGGGHYDNMTRPGYTLVACGFHTTADGQVWAVQDFQ